MSMLMLMCAALSQDLAGPSTLLTRQGQTWHGVLDGIEDQHLKLRSEAGGGEVWRLWSREQIIELRMPARDWRGKIDQTLNAGDADEGLRLLDQFVQSRLPYLDWVAEDDIIYLARHTRTYLAHNRLWDALSLARQLDDRVSKRFPEISTELLFVQIEGYHQFGHNLTALNRSRQYREDTKGFCTHALPWYLEALPEFEAGNWQATLDWLWHPLLLRASRTIPWIEECYDLAIATAAKMKNPRLVEQLKHSRREIDNPIEDNDDPSIHHTLGH